MDAEDAPVAFSDSQSFDENIPDRTFLGEQMHAFSYLNNQDEYNDIYFDKSCANADDARSIWNFSNYLKEINLDLDQYSENDLFIRPEPPEFSASKQILMNSRKIFEDEPAPVNEDLNLWPGFEMDSNIKQDMVGPSELLTSAGNSRTGKKIKPIETPSPPVE